MGAEVAGGAAPLVECKPMARIGPIDLVPGIGATNGWAFLFAMFFVGILAPFINFAQPYILTEHLAIPQHQQRAVSGNLAFWSA